MLHKALGLILACSMLHAIPLYYTIQNQSKYSITVSIEGEKCAGRIDRVTSIIAPQNHHTLKMSEHCSNYKVVVKASTKTASKMPLPKSEALIVVTNTTESIHPEAPLELSVQPMQ